MAPNGSHLVFASVADFWPSCMQIIHSCHVYVAVVCMCSFAMVQFARSFLACFGVAWSMLAVVSLRGLDTDPLRLWWLSLCVLWRSVCSPARTSSSAWLSTGHRICLLCSCHPFSVGRLLDVGLVSR